MQSEPPTPTNTTMNAISLLEETTNTTKSPLMAAAAQRVKARMENTMAAAVKLVDPTFRRASASRTQRAHRLLSFANSHAVSIRDIEIVENNHWTIPPRGYRDAFLLGGTTYQYQVWACLK